ncbi:MAG TPA: alkaline phosphatase PhoX, partial [Acidimicrobiales bacterium]|nr:alkaline phosphatase PhoX [Acidimicrobiales bacterium]
VHLVRNHEKGNGTPFADAGSVYDPTSSGGTTTLVFDPDEGRLVDSYASLSGTIRNCAGGPTPAGSWLSCEETTQVNPGDVRHGYVFEVPSSGLAGAEPLRAMGRFSHEATATDPMTGYVYETEDTGDSLLYRFRPNDAADLAQGGVLEAMVLDGTTDTRQWTTGTSARVARWETIAIPDPSATDPTTRAQGKAAGAALITRGEGIWYGDGMVYVVASNGGPAGQGQVFALDLATDTFTAIFTSPSSEVLNAPDNICVSPRGGLVVCEDGSGLEYLHGLTPDGQIFRFAQNNVVLAGTKGFSGSFTGSEWCGATFEPGNGNWLFVNIQSPGITFAITGPWRQGPL